MYRGRKKNKRQNARNMVRPCKPPKLKSCGIVIKDSSKRGENLFIDPHYQAGRLDDERQLKPFIDWLNTLPEKKKNKVYEGMTLEQLCKTENMQQYCAMWEGMDYACELMRQCWDIYSEVLKERAERKYLAIRAEAEKTGKFEKSIIPDGVDFWEYVNEHWEKAPSCIQPYNYY